MLFNLYYSLHYSRKERRAMASSVPSLCISRGHLLNGLRNSSHLSWHLTGWSEWRVDAGYLPLQPHCPSRPETVLPKLQLNGWNQKSSGISIPLYIQTHAYNIHLYPSPSLSFCALKEFPTNYLIIKHGVNHFIILILTFQIKTNNHVYIKNSNVY